VEMIIKVFMMLCDQCQEVLTLYCISAHLHLCQYPRGRMIPHSDPCLYAHSQR
jgi:hypothetical protein